MLVYHIRLDMVRSCSDYDCPCDATFPSLPFVSNDYFCESIVTTRTSHINANGKALYLNATLWDGQVCEGGGTCCKFNNPPWFTKNLHQLNSTTDGIDYDCALTMVLPALIFT